MKKYAETKAGWKRKFSAKEGELEAIKVCIHMLVAISLLILSFRQLTQIWLPN